MLYSMDIVMDTEFIEGIEFFYSPAVVKESFSSPLAQLVFSHNMT